MFEVWNRAHVPIQPCPFGSAEARPGTPKGGFSDPRLPPQKSSHSSHSSPWSHRVAPRWWGWKLNQRVPGANTRSPKRCWRRTAAIWKKLAPCPNPSVAAPRSGDWQPVTPIWRKRALRGVQARRGETGTGAASRRSICGRRLGKPLSGFAPLSLPPSRWQATRKSGWPGRWRLLECEACREAERFYRRLKQGVAAERARGRERADAQTLVAIETLLAFSGLGELRVRLAQLSRRFERLARVFLYHRSGQRPDLQLLARQSRFELNLLMQPEAALGNPFRSSGVIARALKQREETVERPLPEPAAWRPWGSGATRLQAAAMPVSLPEDFNAHCARLRAALDLPEGNPTVQAALERAAETSWQRLRRL